MVSVLEAMETAATASSTKFQVDYSKLAGSGMMSFKYWANECDNNEPTSPTHGDSQVVK